MTTVQLYGHPHSTCTRRAATILYETKTPFELVVINMAGGENRTPEYLEKQPFGQTPYIDDDGFILYETRAIGRYIAAKNPASNLIPKDLKKHALFEQAASSELTNFDFAASIVSWEAHSKPPLDLPTDYTVLTAQIALLDAKLAGYERILAKQRYIAGDELTLADLFHLPNLPILVRAAGGAKFLANKLNVARWLEALVARESWLAFEGGVKTTLKYN